MGAFPLLRTLPTSGLGPVLERRSSDVGSGVACARSVSGYIPCTTYLIVACTLLRVWCVLRLPLLGVYRGDISKGECPDGIHSLHHGWNGALYLPFRRVGSLHV